MKLFAPFRLALPAAAVLAVLALGVRADDVGPDVARRLLAEGRIKPLTEILAAVRPHVPGDVLEVELELEKGVYVYEIKVLRSNGRVQEVEADAATGKILTIEDDD